MEVLNLQFIKERRLKLGLSLARAAKRAGLPHASKWQQIENGAIKAITVQTLSGMAKALRSHPGKLMIVKTRKKKLADPSPVVHQQSEGS